MIYERSARLHIASKDRHVDLARDVGMIELVHNYYTLESYIYSYNTVVQVHLRF